LTDYSLFYFPLFTVLRPAQEFFTNNCLWRASKFKPVLGDLWAGRDLYRATSSATRGLGFSGLIQRTAPFSRLLRHTRGCGWCILTRFLTGPHLVAFLVWGNLLTNKLMSQGFLLSRQCWHAAFSKFYGRYNDLICPYNLSLGYMLSDLFHTNR
jgi:hypothetical protein